MQSKEFDNLMMGSPAKWADMTKDLFNDKSKPTLTEVKKHEKPIPELKRLDMVSFIQGLRSNGYTENKIRRVVKKEFHIQIVR